MPNVNIAPPTRNELRAVFECAAANAKTPGIRQLALDVSQYHELMWMARDKVDAQAKADEAAKTPPPPPDGNAGADGATAATPERQLSAVEQHGINSPEAAAMCAARKAKRLAGKAEAQPDGQAEAT